VIIEDVNNGRRMANSGTGIFGRLYDLIAFHDGEYVVLRDALLEREAHQIFDDCGNKDHCKMRGHQHDVVDKLLLSALRICNRDLWFALTERMRLTAPDPAVY